MSDWESLNTYSALPVRVELEPIGSTGLSGRRTRIVFIGDVQQHGRGGVMNGDIFGGVAALGGFAEGPESAICVGSRGHPLRPAARRGGMSDPKRGWVPCPRLCVGMRTKLTGL